MIQDVFEAPLTCGCFKVRSRSWPRDVTNCATSRKTIKKKKQKKRVNRRQSQGRIQRIIFRFTSLLFEALNYSLLGPPHRAPLRRAPGAAGKRAAALLRRAGRNQGGGGGRRGGGGGGSSDSPDSQSSLLVTSAARFVFAGLGSDRSAADYLSPRRRHLNSGRTPRKGPPLPPGTPPGRVWPPRDG